MTGEVCVSEPFGIELEGVVSKNPTLKAPSFAFVENPFIVTGETPEPNQVVWIELETILFDEGIARGQSDINRNFEIEVQLTELGMNKIHSEIEVFGLNKTSQTRSVLTLNYLMSLLLILIILYIIYKLYQKHGKKKGGRKRK